MLAFCKIKFENNDEQFCLKEKIILLLLFLIVVFIIAEDSQIRKDLSTVRINLRNNFEFVDVWQNLSLVRSNQLHLSKCPKFSYVKNSH